MAATTTRTATMPITHEIFFLVSMVPSFRLEKLGCRYGRRLRNAPVPLAFAGCTRSRSALCIHRSPFAAILEGGCRARAPGASASDRQQPASWRISCHSCFRIPSATAALGADPADRQEEDQEHAAEGQPQVGKLEAERGRNRQKP